MPGLIGRKYILDARKIEIDEIISGFGGRVVIFHGSDDNAVPLAFSINASKIYKNAELIIIPDEKHNLSIKGKQTVLNKIINEIKG